MVAQHKGQPQDSDPARDSGRLAEGQVEDSGRPVLDPRLANDLPAHDLAQGKGLQVGVAATPSETSDQVERLIDRPREAARAWAGVAVAVEAACAAAAEVVAAAVAEVAVEAAEAVVVVVVVEGAPISPSSTTSLYWAISQTVSATIASATKGVIALMSA